MFNFVTVYPPRFKPCSKVTERAIECWWKSGSAVEHSAWKWFCHRAGWFRYWLLRAFLSSWPHIDYIKIDHSFVGRVNADQNQPEFWIVYWIWRVTSIGIVAEGVETKEQLDYLNQNNITFQQGYYFYKPVTYIDWSKLSFLNRRWRLWLSENWSVRP